MQLDKIITFATFAYLTFEFVFYKGFGKKAVLLTSCQWLWKILNSGSEIRKMIEAQNEKHQEQSGLIYSITASVEKIEREVVFNGGKFKLVDAVKEVLQNQAVFLSEREAKLFIDPMPIFKTDDEGKVTFVNAAWMEMVGCTDEEEMMGYGYLAIVPPENRNEVERMAERTARSPVPYNGEFVYQHLKTKVLINTNVRTQLIHDRYGKYVGAIGMVRIL